MTQGGLSVITIVRLNSGKVVFGVDAVYHFEVTHRILLLIAVKIYGLQVF